MRFAYTIFPLSDSALTVDFGNRIDETINENVLRLFKKLQGLSPHFLDVVPAYSSVTVYYDAVALRSKESSAFERAKKLIEPLLQEEESNIPVQRRQVKIPVCYSEKFAFDLKELSRQKGLSIDEAIRLHMAKTYRVFMIGFLPGFAYMGKVDERIATPRRSQPRTAVPAGAVGIAGEQTGIYPLTSPGGWNIIGRTPLKMFDASKEDAVLLAPGDEVTFYSISDDEFENYQGRPA
jgi:inhibitor of KinA